MWYTPVVQDVSISPNGTQRICLLNPNPPVCPIHPRVPKVPRLSSTVTGGLRFWGLGPEGLTCRPLNHKNSNDRNKSNTTNRSDNRNTENAHDNNPKTQSIGSSSVTCTELGFCSATAFPEHAEVWISTLSYAPDATWNPTSSNVTKAAKKLHFVTVFDFHCSMQKVFNTVLV